MHVSSRLFQAWTAAEHPTDAIVVRDVEIEAREGDGIRAAMDTPGSQT
jgi:hypothetical protein